MTRRRAVWSPPRSPPSNAGGCTRNGVHEFHFYTLNRADLIVAICHLLGIRAREAGVAVSALIASNAEQLMTHLLDYLADRVLLCDGAMGTQVQARDLDIERDFHGHENCTEILCESRPDLVREIHLDLSARRLRRGQTNSFGGSPITLGEFGIADKAFDLNRRAAELAREAVAEFARDGHTRFVFGSVGPGTRLPSLGHVAYQDLEDALAVQCAGLVAGGVDAIPDRDLPGPAADQGRGQRREAGARATARARTSRSSSR